MSTSVEAACGTGACKKQKTSECHELDKKEQTAECHAEKNGTCTGERPAVVRVVGVFGLENRS